MQYPDRPVTEEKIDRMNLPISPGRPVDKRTPQIATMFEQIATRLNEQAKLLEILKERLSPILAPVPKSDEEANKVENSVVPLAEGLRDISKKIATHNHWIDMMISGVEL